MLGLTKFYGRDRGIEDLSLRVEPGEVFGLLGPNGAGKTTAIPLLLDLIRPTSALVCGFAANRDSLEVRCRVGDLPGELKPPERSTARRLHYEHSEPLTKRARPHSCSRLAYSQ